MSEDIIERLKQLLVWMPEKTTIGDGPGWGQHIISDAIAEIEFLRTQVGAVTRGESFDDLARRQGRIHQGE